MSVSAAAVVTVEDGCKSVAPGTHQTQVTDLSDLN